MNGITCRQLESGATLVVERIDNVASAAMSWLLPVGTASDPEDGDGQAVLLSELIYRGAGGLSSREHSDALDRLGVQRSGHASTHHLRLDFTCLGDRLPALLPLVRDMVREPGLPAESLAPVRSLCLQALDSLDDDPQHLVMLRLRQRHLPPPFNRHGYGRREVLEETSIEMLRSAWTARCRPGDTIIAVAGAVDADALATQLDRELAGWSGRQDEPGVTGDAAGGSDHLSQDTAQVHIGLACDAPPEPDADSMLERLAIAVLSGGTSARLFTEVRQKRSLCYSVGASYRAGRDRGMIALYAGTTPQRAQATLDVSIDQIRRLREGVTAEELARAVIGIKSHLIMQGESTAARSSALAADCFRLGRARSLTEVAAAIDAITLDQLNDYLARRQFGPFSVASIGPVELGVEAAAAAS